MDAPDLDEHPIPDDACAVCGHEAALHIVRETEAAGVTLRDSYCEACEAACEFAPDPRDQL